MKEQKNRGEKEERIFPSHFLFISYPLYDEAACNDYSGNEVLLPVNGGGLFDVMRSF